MARWGGSVEPPGGYSQWQFEASYERNPTVYIGIGTLILIIILLILIF
jgi:hypothetical protein